LLAGKIAGAYKGILLEWGPMRKQGGHFVVGESPLGELGRLVPGSLVGERSSLPGARGLKVEHGF